MTGVGSEPRAFDLAGLGWVTVKGFTVKPRPRARRLKLRLSEWTGATAVGQAKTTITLSTDWQPIKVRYTAAAPGSSTLDLSSYVHDAPPGSCFSADDISIAWG